MAVRLLASVAALCVGVAGIAIVAVLLHRTPGPVSTATSAATAAAVATPVRPAATSTSRGFPAPPPSAVVFTRQDGGTVLALAVTPDPLRLQLSVLGPTGKGTAGLNVAFSAAGRRANAVACGAGCYRASLRAPAHPGPVRVILHGGGLDTAWSQRLPTVWPAPDATALVERAGRVWRSLQSLAYLEHLASDPQHAITSAWRIGAPDRVAYQVLGGYAGIVIGDRRWDRAPGGRWVESPQSSPLTQPVPFWTSVSNAHLLGSIVVRGRPVWIVSFFDPTIPAWFKIAIEKRTTRTLNMQMMATAHFMHDAYGSFDRARPVTPP